MFRIFGKKKVHPLSSTLDLSPRAFADVVSEAFCGLDSATLAHILVARENLGPIMAVMPAEMRKKGKDYTIEDFLKALYERWGEIEADEVNSRRNTWFAFAGLLYRLEGMARADKSHAQAAARSWVALAESAPFLRALLPENVVWRSEEKVWFAPIMKDDDDECVIWAIQQAMPMFLWNIGPVEELAKRRGLIFTAEANSRLFGPLLRVKMPRQE